MKERMYILTDSLGCPREEISVEKTWTEGIIQKWSDCYAIYTQCVRGQSLRNVVSQFVLDYKPSVIVTQMGIVDAARRVLRPLEQQLISVIFRGHTETIRNYISKRHYKLTKRRNYRYCQLVVYERFYKELLENSNAKIVIIPIAPAGNYIKKQTYNIEADIKDFNEYFARLQSNNPNRVFLVNAYKKMSNINDFVLEDGHHLNEEGNRILFDECNKIIESLSK